MTQENHFNKIKKGIWTLALLTALGIGFSSCTSAPKKVPVSPSKPSVQLEYRVGESFVKNKPFAEIKEYGNPQSDKIVYYIPQVHIPRVPDYISRDLILDCQIDIYKVIEDLHRNHDVDLVGQIVDAEHAHCQEFAQDDLVQLRQQESDRPCRSHAEREAPHLAQLRKRKFRPPLPCR